MRLTVNAGISTYSCSDRVVVDVHDDVSAIANAVYVPRAIASSEQWAITPARAIEPTRVPHLDPMHRHGEFAGDAANQQVPVGQHQAVRVDFDPTASRFACQQGQEEPSVPVIFENRTTGDPAVHHVVPGIRCVVSCASRHG